MVVQHNITAINANRYFGINNNKLSKSLEKLSSGYAINRAGDNAAGLAVSEKMRSQIAGINQGVKNAQDGISMIQTFEGALTETDSILQRMKVLADQSANGTYQNEVDRDAIQLEFNQLNDELNQIADTDFNGVVVLNGGQMADGLKAVNGKFDYADGTAYAPTKLGKNDVNVLDSNVWDDASKANTAWSKLNATWTRTPGEPATYGPDSVDITFQYDKSTSSWKATSATNGASIKEVDTDKTENGGFKVLIGDAEVSNVILDQSVLNNGDTITLTFNNPSAGISAPTNAGAVVADDSNFTENDLKLVDANNLTVLHGAIDPAKKTALAAAEAAVNTATTGLQDVYDAAVGTAGTALDGIDLTKDLAGQAAYGALGTTDKGKVDDAKTAYDNLQTGLAAIETAKANLYKGIKAPGSTDMTADVNELYDQLNGATFEAKYTDDASVDGDFKIVLNNGTELTADATTGTEFVIGDTTFLMKTDGTNGTVTITDKNETTTYLTVVAKSQADATDKTNNKFNSTGSISWTLGIDNNTFDSAAKPTVEVAKTGSVSKSNAYSQASAPLTYTDHIALQAGARTKDLVDFTFQYTSDGLGDLKADLDCSARGLGTDKLNLSTQEAANYAIDRIDNAINKTNMVRATFGAVQNRLEHKIDNLNVTSENLTSAESRIRDTNMAEEMMNFTKNQILSQASQSMLAQANQLPQGVLSLLQ